MLDDRCLDYYPRIARSLMSFKGTFHFFLIWILILCLHICLGTILLSWNNNQGTLLLYNG